MKKILVIGLLIVPFCIFAQGIEQIDNDYLDSLPESIREDVENEMKRKDESEKDSLTLRPSSELMKSQIVKDWEEFKLKKESELYNSERYGINIFRTMQSTFMPINEPNFGSNYLLDYGDLIEINLYGSKEETYELEIKRDGSIFFPEIGPISLAGLNFQQATSKISNKVKESFIGVDTDVGIGKIRDIKVLISGMVEYPGIYTLSGNSNILQAINIAGGIQEKGSLRNIEIKKNGITSEYIDFYEALLFGDISKINQLQSGDAIYVPPAKKLIRAGSGFLNQAIFELKNNETIIDLIKYSGGLDNKSIYEEEFTITRLNQDSINTINLDSTEILNFKLENSDSIYLPTNNFGTIKIRGEVNRPGNYTLNSNDTIYDVVLRAGGYTKNAYQFAGILTSQKAKKLERNYIERTYNDLIKYIAINPSILGQNQSVISLLDQIKNLEPSGRVVTEFNLNKINENSRNAVLLGDKDEIYIPALNNVIYVYGDVNNPSALNFEDFKNPIDYINKAGGYSRFADKDYVYIISPNGEANILNKRALSNLNIYNIDLYPGSLIYVPKRINFRDGVQLVSSIAPIFSSLALSLASLNAISDD